MPARQFALSRGFKETNTLSPSAKIKWEEAMRKRPEDRPFQQLKHTIKAEPKPRELTDAQKAFQKSVGHDTVGLLVLTRERGLYLSLIHI